MENWEGRVGNLMNHALRDMTMSAIAEELDVTLQLVPLIAQCEAPLPPPIPFVRSPIQL